MFVDDFLSKFILKSCIEHEVMINYYDMFKTCFINPKHFNRIFYMNLNLECAHYRCKNNLLRIIEENYFLNSMKLSKKISQNTSLNPEQENRYLEKKIKVINILIFI